MRTQQLDKSLPCALSQSLMLCMLLAMSNIASAETPKVIDNKPEKGSPFYDIGKDFLYLLDSFNKKDVEAMQIYDKSLIKIGAVDKDYKYTDLDKVQKIYSRLKKNSKANVKVISSTPYNITAKVQLDHETTDDFEILFLEAVWQSPSMIKGICERFYTPKAFRANNVKMTYLYTDKQGNKLFTHTLDMETCKGTIPIKNYQPTKITADEKVSELTKKLNYRFKSHINNATQAERESFYYKLAMGRQFSKGKDTPSTIIDTGKKLVERINRVENNDKLTQEQQQKTVSDISQKFYTTPKISTPENTLPLFCFAKNDTSDKRCFSSLLAHKNQWQPTLDTPVNQIIIERYQTYLHMAPAVTVFAENIVTNPSPMYRLLLAGQKLNRLEILQLAELDKNQQALDRAVKELKQIRKHFAKADTLLEKKIFKSMMTEQLQTIMSLKTKVTTDTSLFFTPIEPLSREELSINNALLYEYRMPYVLLMDSAKSTNQKQMRRYFKLNESVNNNAKIYRKLMIDSHKSASQTAKMILNQENKNWDIESMFSKSNKLGLQLVGMSIISLDFYSVNSHNINNQINAVNHVLSGGQVTLINTFSPQLRGVTNNNEKICYEIPESSNKTDKTLVSESCFLL